MISPSANGECGLFPATAEGDEVGGAFVVTLAHRGGWQGDGMEKGSLETDALEASCGTTSGTPGSPGESEVGL